MTTEDAILADVRENPDDDTPRLVLADWLDDHGDADRAEFIRAGVAAARLPPREAKAPAARAEELLRRHWDEWTAPLWKVLGSVLVSSSPVVRFHRGFIHELTLDCSVFVARARALFALGPIGRLRLLQAGGNGRALANCEPLANLRELEFVDYYREPLTADDMMRLADSPYLGGLRVLRLARNHLGDTGVVALSGAAWLSRLVALDLTDNGLSSAACSALVLGADGFRPLWLNLSRNALTDNGVCILGCFPGLLGGLHWLDLSGCEVGPDGLRGLARCPLGGLRHLDLSHNVFTDDCADALADADWLPTLDRLVLRGNRLSSEGLGLLARLAPETHLVLS